jgi:cell division protein FtsB
MSIDLQKKLKSMAVRCAPFAFGLIVVLLMVHDVFGTHGYLSMRRKQQDIQKVKADLDRLNTENTGLEQDVKSLKTDPHAIEKIAREEMGQARAGEKIFKLPAQASAPVEKPPAKP